METTPRVDSTSTPFAEFAEFEPPSPRFAPRPSNSGFRWAGTAEPGEGCDWTGLVATILKGGVSTLGLPRPPRSEKGWQVESQGRRYAGEPDSTRAARRRLRLLESGLELFGTRGYRATTVRELCSAARVSHRTFYQEFASAEDLLLAVYASCLDRLVEVVVAAIPLDAPDPTGTFRSGVDAFLSEIRSDPRLARVVWFEVLGVSERVEAAYLGRMEEFTAFFGGLLDAWGLTFQVAPVTRTVILRMLTGGISHVSMVWVKQGFEEPQAQIAEAIVRLLQACAAMLVQLDETLPERPSE